MRIDELRHELHTQADQAGRTRHDLSAHRLEDVQGRVHRIRRRRATGAAVGAVAAVALVAVAVVPSLQSQRSAPPPASGPDKTVHADRPNPWEWRQTVAGDTLSMGMVGERGQSTLTRTFTPGDTDLWFRAFCDTAPRPGLGSVLMMNYSVNGNEVGATGCVQRSNASLAATSSYFKDAAAGNREAWADLGVRPGQPVTVRLWVEDANRKHVRLPDLRLGFAMYQRTAARIERDGVVIPTMIESRGGTYQLTDYTIERLTDANRSARLAVPAADVPRVVRSGLESKGTAPYARVHPYVDGRELAGVSGEGIVGDPLLDRGAHVLGVRVRGGKAARGSLLISVYELVRNS